MLKLTLALLLLSSVAWAQKGVPGTLNQIENDPAQAEFENEYDDLRKTVKDLDKPIQKEDEREAKLPSNKIKKDKLKN